MRMRRVRLLLMSRMREVRNLSLPVMVSSFLPLAALNDASDGGASKSQDGKGCLLNHLERLKVSGSLETKVLRIISE